MMDTTDRPFAVGDFVRWTHGPRWFDGVIIDIYDGGRSASAEVMAGNNFYRVGDRVGYVKVEKLQMIRPARPVRIAKAPDPLEVQYDGVSLRALLTEDEAQRREEWDGYLFTTGQRAAISAHWSAELRARVAASKERERRRVVLDLEEP